MAEQASSEKKSKPGFFKKMGKSFKDMKGEVKKIVWPSKSSIINNTIVVIVVCLIFGAFIWGLDAVLTGLVRLVLNNA
ncbi:preprotein translocase subunit SecE [Hydrogenoanaerobacterium saccharovorans]|uniref:Protein translocase subunit SecE n=1 Tax=Hydrogenoanaerobacterium saccharovorans TaxID=474960 RepID=A0A1H8BD31_9FIRM|nr:preprotein translocase subunit SecE [Hydrogenoanaerobacterium saccharovorans]RPF47488.1 preprotein translocase subunit SecE [Hydrogenoanaerobacterium saccharovorans]SEM80359.1 preprotein translocase subunit SecE [Hydrogenoanaerobacterium saccharovorans]